MSKRRSWGKLTRQPARWVTYHDEQLDDVPTVPCWFALPMPEPWDEYLWHQWLSAWGDVLLSVCKNVWRNQGSKLYATHHDQDLRDDLEDWLIVKAMEDAADFLPDPWHPNPHRQFAKYLYSNLEMKASYHFSDVVGRNEPDNPAGQAARAAYSAGIVSTDYLTEREVEGARPVSRHPLHGADVMVENPLNILVRMEELDEQIAKIEREDRREGRYITGSQRACLQNQCSGPVVAWGLCDAHARKQQRLWGADRGNGCNVPGCLEGHKSRGLCDRHYAQLLADALPHDLLQYVETERRKPGPKRGSKKHAAICIEEGCTSGTYGLDRCRPHYRAHKKVTAEPCVVDGCTNPMYVRRMCSLHYQRWKKERGRGEA